MEETPENARVHIKRRLKSIRKHLDGNATKYNSITRKHNKSYLEHFIKHRAEVSKPLVIQRREEAQKLLGELKARNTPIRGAPDAPVTEKSTEEEKGKSSDNKPNKKPDVCDAVTDQKYEITVVAGDGNCFFYSLYGAAKNHPDETVIQRVFEALKADKTYIDDIKLGPNALRKGFANIVQRDLPAQAEGVFEQFQEYIGTVMFDEHIKVLADDAKKALFRSIVEYTGAPGKTKRDFYSKLATIIREDTRYVDGIEYKLIRELLALKDVTMINQHANPTTICKEGLPTLYLKRVNDNHYDYWKIVKADEPMPEDDASAMNDSHTNKEKVSSAKNPDAAEPLPVINTICDPFSCETITVDDPLKYLEKRIRDERTKQLQLKIENYTVLPHFSTMSRLDLLLHFLNGKIPDDTLLECKDEKGTPKATSLFESYWDIVIAISRGIEKNGKAIFGLKDKIMYDGKVEQLNSYDIISDKSYTIARLFDYLDQRKVATSSSGGASDITVIYKRDGKKIQDTKCATQQGSEDPCSNELVIVSEHPRNEIIMCSSKLFGKEKSIDKYDIQNIWTASNNLDGGKTVVLLVRDSNHVSKTLQDAQRKYLSGKVSLTLGWNDCLRELSIVYDAVKKQKALLGIAKADKSNIAQLLMFDVAKPTNKQLKLLFHQTMAVNFVVKGISDKMEPPRFLIGILPRGGKTYIAGGIVRDLNPKRVLVVLGAKTETQSQFIKELFDVKQQGFVDFAKYEVHDVLTFKGKLEKDKQYIFVCSTENLKLKRSKPKESDKQAYNLIKTLFDNKLDLIIVDEAHQKLLTKRGEVAFRKSTDEKDVDEDVDELSAGEEYIAIPYDKVPTVFMTGTYSKFMGSLESDEFHVPKQNMILWDYEDVQNAKSLSNPEVQQTLSRSFPNFNETLEYYMNVRKQTLSEISAAYQQFPILHLLTTDFTEEVKKQTQIGRGMPDITQCQRVKEKTVLTGKDASVWWKELERPGELLRLINYLAPSTKANLKLEEADIEPIGSVMERIDHIASRVGDRLANITSHFTPHSQLWFLAKSTKGQTVNNRMPAIASLVLQNDWFRKNFDIICISQTEWRKKLDLQKETRTFTVGDAKIIFACPDDGPLKECICRYEAISRKNNRGLVILAEGMLKLGISLPCVDIVGLLDDRKGIDDRIQKMYRCLTQAPYKLAGYIVDFNTRRSVTAIIGYQILKMKQVKKGHLVREDEDEIYSRVLNTYQIDDDIHRYKTSVESGGDIAELKKMFDVKLFRSGSLAAAAAQLNEDIDESNIYISGFDENLGIFTEGKKGKQVIRKADEDVPVAPEVAAEEDNESVKEPGPKNEAKPKEKPLEEPALKDSFEKIQKDIVKTVLKLGAFGTQYKSQDELIRDLRTNKDMQTELLETLFRRDLIKDPEDETVIKRIVIPLLEKSISDKQRGLYATMRGKVNLASESHIDEVLDYINDHLAPKEKERHKYGEVFTPLHLVDEMLSTLPKSVWEEPDWKWLDPANGIGNFPIKAFLGQHTGEHQFPGLLHGLAKKIPDVDKRCKHIVENMLYMVDINGKNNAIARRLFEKLCPGAVANIEKIDAKEGFLKDKPLVFNSKEVKEFDVVMGNPPFNRGGINRPDTRKQKKQPAYEGEKKEKKETIWNKFIIQSFKKLKANGYLLFIHPIGWFHSGKYDDVRDVLLSRQIKKIKIYKHDSQSVNEFSGSGKITTAYYLMENKPVYKNTVINGTSRKEENIELNKDSIILLNNSSIISKLISKSSFWKDNKKFRHTAVPCIPGSHKQISGIYENGKILTVKTNQKHIDSNAEKIIISGRDYPRVYYDKGEYGLVGSGVNYWVGTDDELNVLNDFLNTKLSAFLTKELKFRQDFVEFKYFPDITQIHFDKKVTDDVLADYFKFDEDERKVINATDYPKREYKFKESSCAEANTNGKKEDGYESDAAEGGARPRRFTRKIRRS